MRKEQTYKCIDDFVEGLNAKYRIKPITEMLKNEMEADLGAFEHRFGIRLTVIIDHDTFNIRTAYPLLFLLGDYLPGNREHELICNEQYGYTVVIRYRDESPYSERESTFHNVTEVHYKFASPIGEQVAFESNIHGTGFTRFLKDIDYIGITFSDKIAGNLFE